MFDTMTEATRAGLSEVAGAQLYRRNAFRLTGLPAGTDRRVVRHRRQQVAAALRVGADVDLGHGLAVEPAAVEAAFERILGDQRRRLVDELFWLWGEPDGCPCRPQLHRDHDEAVRAHSAALDLELAEHRAADQLGQAETLWAEAATRWTAALRRPAFWDHVRHRIRVLDDRQLDESVVDVLRAEIPAVLVRPMIELAVGDHDDPAWLVGQLASWPVAEHRVDDLLEAAVGPVYDALEVALRDAARRLNAGAPRKAVGALTQRAVPALNRLAPLVPHERHRRTAVLRDRTAALYNNCANALVDELGAGAEQPAMVWLWRAAELAVDPTTRSTIEQNRHELLELVRVLADVQAQVSHLVAMGQRGEAVALLDRVRQLTDGGTGTRAIDQMLAEIGVPAAPPRGSRTGVVLTVVGLAVVVFLVVVLVSGCGGAAVVRP